MGDFSKNQLSFDIPAAHGHLRLLLKMLRSFDFPFYFFFASPEALV